MAGTEKTAIVTGGGSGVGRAVALAFGRDGYKVLITGRRQEPLDETIALRAEAAMTAFPADVSREADVDALFSQAKSQFGRLDVIFNNAGTGAPAAPVGDITPAQWRAVIDVNLTGAFLCTRAAFNMMREQEPQGGRIINNGSISAHVPRLGSAPYTASKHAITGLTRSTSLDGRPFNIACGQIDIGNAATPMTARMPEGVPQADGSIAAEPVMDVEHVANAVLHMVGLPLEANVQFMTIMATTMPYIGRG